MNKSRPKRSSSDLKISQMKFEDLPKVFALGEQVFTAKKWSNLYRTWDEYELMERFIGDNEFCMVAKIKQEIVGFAIGAIIEKKRSAWAYGYLQWLCVAPNQNNQGIGKKLINKITRLFIESGARMLLVDTEIENLPAIKFFKKNGFKEENEQLYLSKNLTDHPLYKKQK